MYKKMKKIRKNKEILKGHMFNMNKNMKQKLYNLVK